jgi:hypothetical protein
VCLGSTTRSHASAGRYRRICCSSGNNPLQSLLIVLLVATACIYPFDVIYKPALVAIMLNCFSANKSVEPGESPGNPPRPESEKPLPANVTRRLAALRGLLQQEKLDC